MSWPPGRTKTGRGGRRGQLPLTQRNPQLRKGLSWQIAPQPKLAALPHTTRASWKPRRLRIPMIVPGWGWRGERPAWEPCRWGAPASTPWGYQRWDLGLSTSPYQINQPHTCDHTCMHVDTVYVHPHGPRGCTHTHTHTHTRAHRYTQDPWVHMGTHMLTYVNRHPHTCAHGYCTLICRCMQTKTPMCTPQAHTTPHTNTLRHTLRSHTRFYQRPHLHRHRPVLLRRRPGASRQRPAVPGSCGQWRRWRATPCLLLSLWNHRRVSPHLCLHQC